MYHYACCMLWGCCLDTVCSKKLAGVLPNTMQLAKHFTLLTL